MTHELGIKQVNRLKLTPGLKVKLPKPVTFRNGVTLDTFTVEKHKRGLAFVNGNIRYGLNRTQRLELTAV